MLPPIIQMVFRSRGRPKLKKTEKAETEISAGKPKIRPKFRPKFFCFIKEAITQPSWKTCKTASKNLHFDLELLACYDKGNLRNIISIPEKTLK